MILVLASTISWSQVQISGTVIFKADKSTAPGINVIEKGTKNGILTDLNGEFKLTVNDPNAILVFSFVGVRTQKVELNGKSEMLVKLKLDCHKDFFDSQQVHIYANSGVINNPLGGQIDLTSPWTFLGVVKGSYKFQTNLENNRLQTGKLELAHSISNCDFDIDFSWNFRQINFDNNLDITVNSFETDLNLRRIKFIAGYTHLDYIDKPIEDFKLSGLVIGIGHYFDIPLHPTAIVKVGLFEDKVEYQALIHGGHKRFLYFLKYYQLDSFNEFSIGIGTSFGYRFKKSKG